MSMEMKYAMVFALLLMMPLISAVPQGKGVLLNGHLKGAMMDVTCKTEFTVSVINSIVDVVPNTSATLTPLAEKIAADTATLQEYADANDSESYRTFLRGTYEVDLKAANRAVIDVRKGRMNKSIRQVLTNAYKDQKDAYNTCHVDAMRAFANARIEGYRAAEAQYRKKIENLKAKNVSTGKLSGVVDAADSQIVTPLQNDVNAAQNMKEIKDAVSRHCLYNGCKDGKNGHLAARFETEKLDAILDRIEPQANAAGLQQQVAEARSSTDDARASLDSIGTKSYTEGQHQAVWGSLKDAAKTIKGIASEIRSAATGNATKPPLRSGTGSTNRNGNKNQTRTE